MSWQSFTDNLVESQKIDKAVIYSRAGDSLWAQTSGFELDSSEIGSIAKGFDNPIEPQSHGVIVQGQKFFVLKAGDRSIYAKKEAEGIIAVRTNQAIIVAHYPAGIVASEATVLVEKLADYLIDVNY